MDLSASRLHAQLDLIEDQGWDGPVAAELLTGLRSCVVRPVVRASQLRGQAADQAEATAWAAAWDAIRRPTARSATNPGGMVWAAVRRSVAAEVRQGLLVGTPVGGLSEMDGSGLAGAAGLPGPTDRRNGEPFVGRLGLVITVLVEAGWERRAVEDVVDVLSETGGGQGWRTAAVCCRRPAWQVRRIARLVQSEGAPPSLLELVVRHGRAAVEHPAASWAAASTLSRWQAGPEASLEMLAAALGSEAVPRSPRRTVDPLGHVAWTPPESAEMMGSSP